MNVLVLMNPAAGGGKTLKKLQRVKNWLPQDKHHFVFVRTESRTELMERAERVEKDGFDAVLAYGGDGTVHDLAAAIKGKDIAFGVLPCGRGNDFVRALGMGTSLKDYCRGLEHPRIREIYIPTVNGIPFLTVAGMGFDGLISRMTREGKCKLGGTICYLLNLLKAMFIFKPVPFRINTPDENIYRRCMMVSVANTAYYGGGMKIAPEADPTAKTLELIIIEAMPVLRLATQFGKVYAGSHISLKEVQLIRTDRLFIESEQQVDFFADGESLGVLPASFEIGSKKIRFLFPRID